MKAVIINHVFYLLDLPPAAMVAIITIIFIDIY